MSSFFGQCVNNNMLAEILRAYLCANERKILSTVTLRMKTNTSCGKSSDSDVDVDDERIRQCNNLASHLFQIPKCWYECGAVVWGKVKFFLLLVTTKNGAKLGPNIVWQTQRTCNLLRALQNSPKTENAPPLYAHHTFQHVVFLVLTNMEIVKVRWDGLRWPIRSTRLRFEAVRNSFGKFKMTIATLGNQIRSSFSTFVAETVSEFSCSV